MENESEPDGMNTIEYPVASRSEYLLLLAIVLFIQHYTHVYEFLCGGTANAESEER